MCKRLIERAAMAVYDSMPYDGVGVKPLWTTGGNSDKQEEARLYAVRVIFEVRDELTIALTPTE